MSKKIKITKRPAKSTLGSNSFSESKIGDSKPEVELKKTTYNQSLAESKPSRRIEYGLIIKKLVSFWRYMLGVLLIGFVGFALYFFFLKTTLTNRNDIAVQSQENTVIEKEQKPSNRPAFSQMDIISNGIPLHRWLSDKGVPAADIILISELASREGCANLRIGDRVIWYYEEEKNPDRIEFLVVEPKSRPEEYYELSLTDSIWVASGKKKVEIVMRESGGIIETNLWETILDNGLRYDLINHMEQALAWTIDFFHVQTGDRFKVIYEEKLIDGRSKAIQKVHAIYFKNRDEHIYAYYFDKGETPAYYDEHGREMKSSFLKSPLKYGRKTSSFSLERIHPVTKEKKAHLGTDYAAPEGTPILAVADGIISTIGEKRNNGKYVKLRHQAPYETQYLHMSRFVPGLKEGSKVQQGDVIGYVGSTGLATGPHVCFRFWKNGKQVDHSKENIGFSKTLPARFQDEFILRRDKLKAELDNILF